MSTPRMLLLSCLAALGSALALTPVLTLRSAAAEEEAPASVFEVTVDGQVQDVVEGQPTALKTKDPSKSVTIVIRRKRIQEYATDHLTFQFDTSFSLKDDKDTSGRTVTLINAGGSSLVLTDHGEKSDEEVLAVLREMVKALTSTFQTNHGEDVHASEASAVKFKTSSGHRVTITYSDPDGDEHECRVHVLRANGRVFSVVHQFAPEHEERDLPLATPTLDSIRGR
ncbi:MAG: hypothetical protein HYZ53_13295 [Planctomycetes bacterium]|nr:hypothetical protein [Planctomycetota bacterium]